MSEYPKLGVFEGVKSNSNNKAVSKMCSRELNLLHDLSYKTFVLIVIIKSFCMILWRDNNFVEN